MVIMMMIIFVDLLTFSEGYEQVLGDIRVKMLPQSKIG